MALRGKKPEAIEQRMKALFYGASGAGKSMAAIHFPKPYWVDTEGSSDKPQYVRIMEEQAGVVFQTQDFDELMVEVKSLLTEKHEYKTLIIDSLTILYNDLLHKAELKVGSEFGRHYGEANKKVKHLMNLLLRLDMNVLIIAHSKNEYGANLSVLGQTFDCYKKLDYLFDIVFEVQKRGKNQRVGIVKKTRYEGFEDSEQFPFSYEELQKRYGKDILEREAVAEVLAAPEQVAQLTHLVDVFKEPQENIQKWLDKAQAETFNEMNQDVIQKLIVHMEKKLTTKGTTV